MALLILILKISKLWKTFKFSFRRSKKKCSGRIKTDEYDKENVQDFALWKAYDESDGEFTGKQV